MLRILPLVSHPHDVLDADDAFVAKETGISFLLQAEHQLDLVLPGGPIQVGENIRCP